MGTKGRSTQEAKAENNTSQKKTIRIKDIYCKLEHIENKIDSSNLTQKRIALYALGVAFIILGLSYWFALLQSTGMDMTTFYLINIPGLLALGTFTLVYASTFKSRQERKDREAKRKEIIKRKK